MAETRVERRLAAVLAADVFGYSRLMGADEEGTLAALKTCRREIIDPKIAEHRGRVVKTTGDGVLVEFASAVDAVRCAIEIQRTMAERNADIPEDSRIILRIGINVGDIIIDEGDIYGDGVNTTARLETLAAPGAICLSENAYQQVKGKLALDVRDMGEQQLKNIAQPVRVYYIDIGGTAAPQAAALALPDKPSIAVLPYQNMSCDPEQDYFADGIVEDIITAMSRFSSLFVIARNSSFTYKGKHVDIKQVGRELGVRYVLEGSVRKSGDRLRVTAQLIDAETGAHVWAETYDRKAIDIFGVQDEITQNVVGAIEPSIRVAEIERSRRKRSDSLNAYDLYLRALPLVYSASRAQNEQAVDLLNQALAADPSFASAATAIGICFAWRAAYGWGNTAEAARQSAKYAQLALELDRENSSALALLARLSGASRKYDEAVIFGQRAVSSNPNSAIAWTNRGWVHLYTEEPEIAKEYLERALRLSPRDPFNYETWVGMAITHVQLEQDDQAVAAARNAVQQNVRHAWAHRLLALSLALAGRTDEAHAAMTEAMEVDPAFSIAWFQSWNPFIHGNKRYVKGFQLAGFPER
jgi:adenylate cyclase